MEGADVQAGDEVLPEPNEKIVVEYAAEAAPFWSQPSSVVEAESESAESHEPTLLFEASRPAPVPAHVEREPVAVQDVAAADSMASLAPLNPAPAGRERLELAIAYLDLGDAETARTLLNEVVTGADPQARNEALELLARLG